MAAADALNCEIEARYDAGERYACQSAPETTGVDAERHAGKMAVKSMLKRVSAIGGWDAMNYALTLLDQGLTIEQAEKAASVKMPQGSLLHRPRTAAPVPAPREPTKEAEI